jgi:NAD-dependent SIR2 family protein deacetylase
LERVVECHGSIHHLQCTRRFCSAGTWESSALDLDGDYAAAVGVVAPVRVNVAVDPTTFRADPNTLPRCNRCQSVARPNILMFGDGGWLSERSDAQYHRMWEWIHTVHQKRGALVVVEAGAGKAVPTVRQMSEHVAEECKGTLIRINPTAAHIPTGTGYSTDYKKISIHMGALDALTKIAARLERDAAKQ